MKNTSDRRLAIRDYISAKRHTTVGELAAEFDVGYNTIIRDLDAITDTTSFYMTKGTGGGVHAVDGWYASSHYFSSAQEEFLKKLQSGLQTEADQKMMESILAAFAMPKAANA